MLSLGLGLTRAGKDPADKVTNGNFVDWTVSTYPDDWVLGNDDVNNYVEEAPADSLHFVSDGTNVFLKQDNILVIGKAYNYEIVVTAASTGALDLRSVDLGDIYKGTMGSVTTYIGTFVATDTGISLIRNAAAAANVTISSIRIWE